MTQKDTALRAATLPIVAVQYVNLAMCLALIAAAIVLRHGFLPAVWVRATIMMIVALVLIFFGAQMRRAKRWAYVRAKWMAIGGAIGFVLVAALPGPFPEWMRIEQSIQALIFVAMAWLVTRPHVAAFFAKPAKRPDGKLAAS